MPFGTATVVTNAGKDIITNRIIGAGTEPKWLALGTGATGADRTAVIADTTLSTQSGSRIGTNIGTRATTTTTNDTFQVVQTYTATGTVALDEAGLFDATTGGNMFVSATFAALNLSADDTVQLTFRVQLT